MFFEKHVNRKNIPEEKFTKKFNWEVAREYSRLANEKRKLYVILAKEELVSNQLISQISKRPVSLNNLRQIEKIQQKPWGIKNQIEAIDVRIKAIRNYCKADHGITDMGVLVKNYNLRTFYQQENQRKIRDHNIEIGLNFLAKATKYAAIGVISLVGVNSGIWTAQAVV